MRRMLNVMPMILLAAGLSASSPEPELPSPAPAHRIQVLRAGKGEPRVRDAATARKAPPRASNKAEGTARSRPYQPAKPGEGEPKG